MEQDSTVRILHVIGVMNRGGAETMVMNLYRNINRDKVQFDFVEHTAERAVFDDEIEQLGGRIYHCPKFTGKNYFAYRKWWDDFFKTNGSDYQIVHGHIGSTAAIYLAAAKKYGKYTIAHSHNTNGNISAKEIMYRALSQRVRNVADFFFACSNPAGRDRFGNKIEFQILNNAIDTNQYAFSKAVRDEVRKEFNLSDELVVGHVGRFSGQKNHDFLIDIFAQIKKEKPTAKLLLVGDGAEKNNIKNKVHQLQLDDSVIFTGVRSDVNRLLQAMDIFVFPSFFEGLPVTMVEAQAAGLPCVISDKVPDECIITDNLVTVKSLSDSCEEWARHILNRVNTVRIDTSDQIKEHGFDISETSKWLEEFYIEKSK